VRCHVYEKVSNANPSDTNPVTHYSNTIATVSIADKETIGVTQLLIIRALELSVLVTAISNASFY